MALDKQLSHPGSDEGVNPTKFAKRCNVNPKTILRDLATFRELGFEMTQRVSEGEPNKWHYTPGTLPLFTKNTRLKIVSKVPEAQ